MTGKTTIHLVFNAHIDPVWLWPWPVGLDEVLATCRTACDLLDANPDLIFTRGEAWCYRQVEQLEPELFQRVRQHVKAGRWEIIGGWWLQPDCNLPSGFAFERQISLGKEYFLDRFGIFPRIGYNVDSFGHAATLPGYLRAAGQDRYVMMRPAEHELKLPARLFRWRGYAGDPAVTTFRIAQAYNSREIALDHVRAAVTELPAGVAHTMCFVGVGDHGGGPTQKQIEWCREHRHAVEGCELVFSSPSRFFDAVQKQVLRLPLVTGELQQHAIGCYTVHRSVKTALRRTEHRLHQAELVCGKAEAQIQEAWEKVCFNQFHDTLGGTCLPSAYAQVDAQLGFAACVADDTLQYALRARLARMPADPLQRVILFNASTMPFDDYVEFEPWLEWDAWRPGTDELLDERGRPVTHQLVQSEGLVNGLSRLLCKLRVAPLEARILRIRRGKKTRAPTIRSLTPIRQQLRLELSADPTDTWSHGIDRYAGKIIARAKWNRAIVADRGPLLASQVQTGKIGNSSLRAEWRTYRDADFVECRLQVHWQERHAVLKLALPLSGPASDHSAGIMGGSLERPSDGREMPVRDWLKCGRGRRALGIVCPDVFAADVSAQKVRLTLLRSPLMAHHVPHSGAAARFTVSDQGAHEFRFRFFDDTDIRPQTLEQHALMLQRPPLMAELTRGMPTRQ